MGEAAAGADFGITTAQNDCAGEEYQMGTEFTHYTEYCAADLVGRNAVVADAKTHGKLVLGAGIWYYVTMPNFKVTAFAGAVAMDCHLTVGKVLYDTMGDIASQHIFKDLPLVKGS